MIYEKNKTNICIGFIFFVHHCLNLLKKYVACYTCCVLYDSLNAEIEGEKRLFIFSLSCVLVCFHKLLRSTKFLPSVFLSTGMNETTFALSGDMSFFLHCC